MEANSAAALGGDGSHGNGTDCRTLIGSMSSVSGGSGGPRPAGLLQPEPQEVATLGC